MSPLRTIRCTDCLRPLHELPPPHGGCVRREVHEAASHALQAAIKREERWARIEASAKAYRDVDAYDFRAENAALVKLYAALEEP